MTLRKNIYKVGNRLTLLYTEVHGTSGGHPTVLFTLFIEFFIHPYLLYSVLRF
jgi:hypothetical protein